MKKSVAIIIAVLLASLLLASCTNADSAQNKKPQIKDEWTEYASGTSECAWTYKTLIAFFTKDTAALASAAGIDEKSIEGFESIEFSSYDISDTDGKAPLSVSFTVSKSSCEAFPAGDYEYTIESFRSFCEVFPFWYRVYDTDTEKTDESCTKLAKSVCQYMMSCAYGQSGYESLNPQYDGVIYSIIKSDIALLGSCSMTAENINKKARELFGISDFNITDGQMEVYRSRAEEQALPLPGVYYDIAAVRIDGDTVEFDIRFFGDCMGLTASHCITYSFEKTDTEYGYRLKEAMVTKHSAVKPGFYEI